MTTDHSIATSLGPTCLVVGPVTFWTDGRVEVTAEIATYEAAAEVVRLLVDGDVFAAAVAGRDAEIARQRATLAYTEVQINSMGAEIEEWEGLAAQAREDRDLFEQQRDEARAALDGERERIGAAIETDDWFDPADIVHHVPDFREGIEYATTRHAHIARSTPPATEKVTYDGFGAPIVRDGGGGV